MTAQNLKLFVKKTSYIVGNNKFKGKICILNLRNKRKIMLVLKKKEDDRGNGQDYN